MQHEMTRQQLVHASTAFQAALDESCQGNLSELARRMGVSPQAVQTWNRTGVVPLKRVPALCKALDDQVTREDIRPDFFN